MYADLHCDTMYKCFTENVDFSCDKLHININKSKTIRPYIQTFALYIPESVNDKFDYLCNMLYNTQKIIDNTDELKLFTKFSDIAFSEQNNKILAVLSVEGADIFCDNESVNRERIRFLRDNHIKFLSLCYNSGSDICGGANCPPEKRLDKKAKQIVYQLASHAITLDISHLNHTSSRDILEMGVNAVATHSCCFEICEHNRNISTENLYRIIEQNGLVGVNFVPWFLNTTKKATIDDIVKHIEYIRSLGGKRSVCFGADFDGVNILPKGISDVSDIIKIRDLLTDHDSVFYNNVKNYLLKNS